MQTSSDYMVKINSLVGQGYWNGTFGQIATESLWNENKVRLPSWYNAHLNAKALWMGKRVADCCGIDKYARWVQADGSIKYDSATDLNEQMMFDKAKALGKKWGAIASIPSIAGLIVWKTGHMGVYRGNGEVVESRGGDEGVVVTKVFDRGWTNWYEEPFLDYGVVVEKFINYTKDTLVNTWQKFLNTKDYGLVVDDEYGKNSATATSDYKSKNGLPADGICDFMTVLYALKETLTAIESLSESVKNKDVRIAALSASELSLQTENAMLERDNAELDKAYADCKNDLAIAKIKVIQLEEELKFTKQTLAEQGAEKDELQKKIADDKFKIDTIEETARINKEIIDNLNQQIAELRSVK